MDGDLKHLPSVQELLRAPVARELTAQTSSDTVKFMLRGALDAMRAELASGTLRGDREALSAEALGRLVRAAAGARKPLLRRVINATGVLLHTNLGRAPLGDEVAAHVAETAAGYATVEYDLARGTRGHRDAVIVPRVTALVGAEDALVVNNNAAAVLLTATALGAGREVVVSRGELVEIGGGFRIPEIMEACGARLIEVGTTNRTHARDYERAITERTAMLLRVHRSNFVQTGFCREVSREELVAVGRARAVPVIEDLGSGAMVDTGRYGIERESTPRESLAAGVELVMFSGDKLLGGPQAGIIAGRRALVEALRRHPLTRALRPGRLVLAALEATLRVYAEGRAERVIPVVRAMAEPAEEVERRAVKLWESLEAGGSSARAVCAVVQTEARIGGGSLPAARLVSWGVRVSGVSARALERALRGGEPAVVARIEDGAVILDVRTVPDEAVEALAGAVRAGLRAKETQRELANDRETGKISGEMAKGVGLWGVENDED